MKLRKSAFDPISREPNYKQCAVRVERCGSARHEAKHRRSGRNGMAGVACVEQILKQQHDFEITIFGDETHVNYNRILLSHGAGRREICRRHRPQRCRLVPAQRNPGASRRADCKVSIARARCDGRRGGETPFDKLILATGSSAFIPPIPGVDKKNVYVFRTLDDTRALLEQARKG